MHLRNNEQVMGHYRRHKMPFIISVTKILIASLPFYAIIYFIRDEVSGSFLFITFLAVSLIVGFFIVYSALIYFLDKLIVTNHRVIMVKWNNPFNRDEYEAQLHDIQDVRSREKGVLSRIKSLDYGKLTIETASSSTTIEFDHLPDPEGIKHFILAYLKAGNGIAVNEVEEKAYNVLNDSQGREK